MAKDKENRISMQGFSLKHGLILAPMAGISDCSFRTVCKSYGAEYTVSEMICAKALCYEQLCKKTDREYFKTGTLAKVKKADLPMAIQIFGSEPEYIGKATELILSNSYKSSQSDSLPSAIDINMGCPVKKIVSNGEGSALMKDEDKACYVASAAVNAACKFNIPVTVKMRAGFDSEHINCVSLAKKLENTGVSAITVHARTAKQMYSGNADYSYIKMVKDAVKIAVIGNGDINSPSDAKRMLDETGCDGIMIGRGAIGNPFIFEEIGAFLEKKEFVRPSKEKIIDTALLQLRMMVEEKGEKIGVAESKKHLCRYIKGFSGSAYTRGELNMALTYSEVEKILTSLLGTQNL